VDQREDEEEAHSGEDATGAPIRRQAPRGRHR